MIKKYFKPLTILLLISFAVNACDDDFFGSDSLEGTWSVYETSTTFGEQNFTVEINYFPSDSSRISIDNFSGLGIFVSVNANVDGLLLDIPSQTVTDQTSNQFTISGNGTISKNLKRISLGYNYDGTNFSATMQKQF
jgi:hypothetical protein